MKLIPNWRRALRMYSVQAQGIALSILGGWQILPNATKEGIPTWIVLTLAMVVIALGIVGRLVEQPSVK